MAKQGIYIQLFSIHGLIRGESPELGRDADTGGQVKYVLELARELAANPMVDQVDLVTRLIYDSTLSKQYAEPIEQISDKARIVRIQCGGRKYIRKENLWRHLYEFIDKNLKFIKAEGRVPDIFHGHYADGGYVASEMASIFGVPFIFTGHSMGRHKKNKLLSEGMKEADIDRRYHIDHRIMVEERVIKEAEIIITSTRHEIDKQYALYDNFTSGNYLVNPPGIDIDTFYPYYDTQFSLSPESETFKQAHVDLLLELHRFWVGPQKPFILALCRPDQRKNIAGLLTAYGEDKDLQAIANLAIFAGIRKNINIMEENEREVLTEMLLLMDRYDLYGKLAIPKKHDFSFEVPELYRICAENHGVFVNPALVEPFGLTLIEAASSGLPIVATNDGGPADIIANCDNGILVDPSSTEEISRACKTLLVDNDLWSACSSNGINGVRHYYSWKAHSDTTLEIYTKNIHRMHHDDPENNGSYKSRAFGRKLAAAKQLLFTDIDNILTGDDDALVLFLDEISQNSDLLWGIATGRPLDLTLKVLAEYNIPVPDIIICSVGTAIYYCTEAGNRLDGGWDYHISYKWQPDRVKAALADLKIINIQDPENQRPFKISYYMKDDPDMLSEVHKTLQGSKLRYNLIFSNNQFLDILPYRASKGKALRYLSYKWNIPLPQIMVVGESGNDIDLLRGDMCAVVVANHSSELENARGLRKTYFSKEEYAAGILDGMRYYNFINGK